MIQSINENLFAFILLIATIVSGAAWTYDFIKERPKRKLNLSKAQEVKTLTKKERKQILEPKGVLGQVGSLFFVLLFVFVFRSFFYEPFRIPSGSMMPTLLSGDFIAVDKSAYGIKNPLTNGTIIEGEKPKRGDIIVFKYPEDKTIDFIKRVVGLPGDRIIYHRKHIYIKKADAPKDEAPILVSTRMIETEEEEFMGFTQSYDVFKESFGDDETHLIRINTSAPDLKEYFYVQKGFEAGEWVVPENCYFAMGDNRDNSKDSRFWGFVPFENIVGKTSTIWLSFEFDRDEKSALPTWIPSAIRFNRIGSID